MSAHRGSRSYTPKQRRKATALLPLTLLSGVWTASLVSVGTGASSAGGGELPSDLLVPANVMDAPAAVSVPGRVAPAVSAGQAAHVLAAASRQGIPDAALAAYQRAAQVINSADPRCNLGWPLVAAIGRVESDHGRYGGSTLSSQGIATPGIYGIRLDGGNGTQRIDDTDAGLVDTDSVFDRAVGPMQFIPTTWSVVGVDSDGDGRRNPQDIDDAALAAAVYLCSGPDDLSTAPGQMAAIHRYNHSREYVGLVRSIAAAYEAGNHFAGPAVTSVPIHLRPAYDETDMRAAAKRHPKRAPSGTHSGSSLAVGAKPTAPQPVREPQGSGDSSATGQQGPLGAVTTVVEDATTGLTGVANSLLGPQSIVGGLVGGLLAP